MGYKWCPYINMFCSDMDFEDKELACDANPYGCDGDCDHCDGAEEVNYWSNYD